MELRPYEPNDLMRRSRSEPVFLKDGGVVYQECEMGRAAYYRIKDAEDKRAARR